MKRTRNQIKAAKIADAVLWAVNSGFAVVPSDQSPPHGIKCLCPLGALPEPRSCKLRYPGSVGLLTTREAERFIRAFDDGIETISFWSHLGILYRRWSQRKYGWTE